MTRFNPGLLVLALVVGVAAGCSVLDGTVTPDGRYYLSTRSGDLTVHPLEGKENDRHIELFSKPEVVHGLQVTEAKSPSYSPDGKWILVAEHQHASLIETTTFKKVAYPSIINCFAWRPDGNQFLGSMGRQVTVYDTLTRRKVRSFLLRHEPTGADWVGDDLLAFYYQESHKPESPHRLKPGNKQSDRESGGHPHTVIVLVDHGKRTEVRDPSIDMVLGYIRSKSTIVFATARDGRESDPFAGIDLALMGLNVHSRTISTMLPMRNWSTLYASDRRLVEQGDFAISTRSSRVAAIGWVDSGPPSTYRMLVDVYRKKLKPKHDPKLDVEYKELEDKVRKTSKLKGTVVALDGTQYIQWFDVNVPFECAHRNKIGWAPDDKHLVVTDGEHTYTVDVPTP